MDQEYNQYKKNEFMVPYEEYMDSIYGDMDEAPFNMYTPDSISGSNSMKGYNPPNYSGYTPNSYNPPPGFGNNNAYYPPSGFGNNNAYYPPSGFGNNNSYYPPSGPSRNMPTNNYDADEQ